MAQIRRIPKKASMLAALAIGPGPSLCASKLRPAPFLSFLLSMALLLQTCALPIPAAFLFISAHAAAVTEGCDTKTCCTALCYVDGHGIHHCKHKHNDACARGESPDESGVNTVLLTTLATAPDVEHVVPALTQVGRVFREPESRTAYYPANPSPPPK